MFFEAFPDPAWVWGNCVSRHLVYFPTKVFITLSLFIYLAPPLHSKHFENNKSFFYIPVSLFLGTNKVPET